MTPSLPAATPLTAIDAPLPISVYALDNSDLLSLIAVLLVRLVANNIYSVVTTYQQWQIEAARVAPSHIKAIGALANASIDSIAEQQLIASE